MVLEKHFVENKLIVPFIWFSLRLLKSGKKLKKSCQINWRGIKVPLVIVDILPRAGCPVAVPPHD